jgi:hypothetical protein
MTLRRIIWQIIEDIERYTITDDSVLDYELIRDKVIEIHQSLMKEYVNSENASLEGYYQTMDCIQLDCKHDHCNIGGIVFIDPTTYYTAIFPPLIKTINYKNTRYFGAHGFAKEITRISLPGFISSDAARWTKHDPVYTMVGDIPVIKNLPPGMATAKLIAILNDPTQACDWTDDDEFPTPSVYKLQLMVKRDIGAIAAPDLLHDAQRALGGQGQEEKQPRQKQSQQEDDQ